MFRLGHNWTDCYHLFFQKPVYILRLCAPCVGINFYKYKVLTGEICHDLAYAPTVIAIFRLRLQTRCLCSLGLDGGISPHREAESHHSF